MMRGIYVLLFGDKKWYEENTEGWRPVFCKGCGEKNKFIRAEHVVYCPECATVWTALKPKEKEMELNSENVEEVRKKMKKYSIVPDTMVVPAHRYAKAIRAMRMYPQRLKAYLKGREDGKMELLKIGSEE